MTKARMSQDPTLITSHLQQRAKHIFSLSTVYELFIYVGVISLSFGISYLFFLFQMQTLPITNENGDAITYLLTSQDIPAAISGGYRTYGYFAFLRLVTAFTSLFTSISDAYSFAILSVQYGVYLAAVMFFSYSVTQNKNYRMLISISLLLNIYVLAYLSITLTEAFSLSLLLICSGIFWGLKRNGLRAFLLGLVSAYALEVRPANLWFYALISIILFLECVEHKNIKQLFLSLSFFALGSLIAFLPQLYMNYQFFHKLTPLPAMGLGSSQYRWGKRVLQISFSFLPSLMHGVENPFLVTTSHPFHLHSINGLSYLVLKVIAIFSHNTLFVYQYPSELQQKFLILFSSFGVYFGFLGLAQQRKNIPYDQLRAVIIGLFLCVFLHMLTVLEDRFTLAICLLLFPIALYQCWQTLKQKNFGILGLYFLFFLLMNLFNTLINGYSPNYLEFIKGGAF